MVLKPFLAGTIASQNFDVNDYGQIVSQKYPNMCLDVKNASTAKGTQLILVTTTKFSNMFSSHSKDPTSKTPPTSSLILLPRISNP